MIIGGTSCLGFPAGTSGGGQRAKLIQGFPVRVPIKYRDELCHAKTSDMKMLSIP